MKTITVNQNCWFTADWHLGHTNIMRYDKRPFSTVEEMDEVIISNHNDLVAPNDPVFFLGDFSYYKPNTILDILDRLNGQWHFIIGNHDRGIKRTNKIKSWFESIAFYKEIYVEDSSAYRKKQFICLSHYPFHEWNKGHYGSWMLHGHSHGNDTYDKSRRIINVGINLNDYKPFSYQQIKQMMAGRKDIMHH